MWLLWEDVKRSDLEVRLQEIMSWWSVWLHLLLNPLDHSLPQPVTIGQETHNYKHKQTQQHESVKLRTTLKAEVCVCRLTGAHICLCWFLCKQIPRAQSHESYIHLPQSVCMYVHVFLDSVCVLTQTVSSVLHMDLGLGDAGVSVQLTVIPVGFAVAATNPVLWSITLLQRDREIQLQMIVL